MKSSTTNVETLIIEEVIHEVSESFQGESSSSSLNDDVQQSPEEVILPSSNTQAISNNMVPNGDEARESSSSSLNDDVQQSPEEVILPKTNTYLILNNMIPKDDEANTSHNVFNERLEDAYFDESTSFHDSSNVHTYYQTYPHEKK
nr:hypothetical protein [Tanacetum cinerariifolium]